MDRRYRALLSWLAAGGALLFSPLARLTAQQPATTPAPAMSATPWVQASPPPGLTPPPPVAPPKPKPSPSPSPKPSASAPSPEDLTREMMRRREAEQHAPDPKTDRHEARTGKKELQAEQAARVDQLPPDERAAYQRNLPLWKQLPEEERDALRKRADERARQEIDRAYQETGLTLDHDQREVFDLRYRQERRRLEHDIQERANAERQRRLAEITAQLKQEFAAKPLPTASAIPAPTKAAPTPDPNANKSGPGIGSTR